MTIYLHKNDLPEEVSLSGDLAIDSETMGLSYDRDRLCLLQISDGQGDVHLIQFIEGNYQCPNLKNLLIDKNRMKIFHFARFDVAMIYRYLGIEEMHNIYCTKIASKPCRTYTELHGLKELCREILNISISKQQQSSDWGSYNLSKEQLEYAANDVLYLHKIRDHLTKMLIRENRINFANHCFNFISIRAKLDIAGWPDIDIFAH